MHDYHLTTVANCYSRVLKNLLVCLLCFVDFLDASKVPKGTNSPLPTLNHEGANQPPIQYPVSKHAPKDTPHSNSKEPVFRVWKRPTSIKKKTTHRIPVGAVDVNTLSNTPTGTKSTGTVAPIPSDPEVAPTSTDPEVAPHQEPASEHNPALEATTPATTTAAEDDNEDKEWNQEEMAFLCQLVTQVCFRSRENDTSNTRFTPAGTQELYEMLIERFPHLENSLKKEPAKKIERQCKRLETLYRCMMVIGNISGIDMTEDGRLGYRQDPGTRLRKTTDEEIKRFGNEVGSVTSDMITRMINSGWDYRFFKKYNYAAFYNHPDIADGTYRLPLYNVEVRLAQARMAEEATRNREAAAKKFKEQRVMADTLSDVFIEKALTRRAAALNRLNAIKAQEKVTEELYDDTLRYLLAEESFSVNAILLLSNEGSADETILTGLEHMVRFKKRDLERNS